MEVDAPVLMVRLHERFYPRHVHLHFMLVGSRVQLAQEIPASRVV
jgi:hypothetical protein